MIDKKSLIESLNEDTVKQLETLEGTDSIDFLNEQAWELRYSNPTLMENLSKQAFLNAKKMGYKIGVAKALRNMGVANAILSNHDKAIAYLQESLYLYEQLENQVGILGCKANLGAVYQKMGQYELALKWHSEALELAKKLDDQQVLSNTLGNLAEIYIALKQYDKAKEYLQEMIPIKERLQDYYSVSVAYESFGRIQMDLGNYESALSYFKKAIDIASEYGEKLALGNAFTSIGIYYYKLSQFKEALKYLNRAEQIIEPAGDKQSHANIQLYLAKVYISLNNLEKSHFYLERALSLAKEIKAKEIVLETLETLAQLYEKEHNYIKAFQTLKTYLQEKDEYYQQFIKDVTLTYSTTLQYEKLKSEKELYQLKNVELARALEELETRTTSLVNSMNYARRIQNSIFPKESQLHSYFSESFLLFLPKEIVCGDFAWLANAHGKIFIAAVDCTGHGVPAALLSILGYNLLREALFDQGLKDPSKILSFLHTKVRETLHQDIANPELPMDGMEIALVTISPKEQMLYYSGAYIPLYLFHKGDLEIIKPDKFPVGGIQTEPFRIFTEHAIPYEKGSRFYLFTDGYANQLHEQTQKRFTTKRVTTLLKEIQNLPLRKQKLEIEKAFLKWKGNFQQVDDVLVIGVEL